MVRRDSTRSLKEPEARPQQFRSQNAYHIIQVDPYSLNSLPQHQLTIIHLDPHICIYMYQCRDVRRFGAKLKKNWQRTFPLLHEPFFSPLQLQVSLLKLSFIGSLPARLPGDPVQRRNTGRSYRSMERTGLQKRGGMGASGLEKVSTNFVLSISPSESSPSKGNCRT